MTDLFYPMLVMGGLGVVFGCLLAFASKKFAVAVDPRQTAIRAALPGANCGGCGFPGCDGYAEACAAGKCETTRCAAGGAPVAAKIAEILGVSAESAEPMTAFVRCRGTASASPKDVVYLGVQDCQAAATVPGRGPAACSFGCLGFGTCVKVCRFGAMSMKDGVARTDPEKCVGCGVCADVCPRGIIAMIPRSKPVRVACSNPMAGIFVRKVCSAGCIGCQMCVKACPAKAISMKGSLAVIDPALCKSCGICASKCPVHAIVTDQ